MLKISEVKHGKQAITLRLEGRIVGPWVAELKAVCEPLMSNGTTLALNLAEVSFADAQAITLLADLISRGVTLVKCSLFVEELLKSAADE